MVDDRALDIVGQVYEAALDDGGWSEPLRAIADYCGAENTALVVTDAKIGKSTIVTPRADPGIVEAYSRHWWQHDPTAMATSSAPAGQLTTLTDTGRETFFSSAFYNEFWSHSGLGAERVAANLLTGDGAFVSCVLQAPVRRDEISNEGYRQFALLVPHVMRAVRGARRLHRIGLERAIAERSTDQSQSAMLVVDAAARIIYADDQAVDSFSTDSGLYAERGMIRLTDGEANVKLRAAVAACANPAPGIPMTDRIVVPSGADASPLILEIIPYRIGEASFGGLNGPAPAAILLVHDRDRRQEMRIAYLRGRFGLTQAEAMLALEMLVGDGRAAAAGRCGISINTARTHLSRIFEKTEVKRQAELIRVLMDAGQAADHG